VTRLLVLAFCALLAAGCNGSEEAAPPTNSPPTANQRAPDTRASLPRNYRELMARLPPFDEPTSPEVAAWRKATISAFFARCFSDGGGADKASSVAANRRILKQAGVFPKAVFVEEHSIGQRDGNGCPEETGPATYYTTYRTYRLPAGTKPGKVLRLYERRLYGWLETAPTACERTYGQGPGYLVVSACNGVLRLSMRARGPVGLPSPATAPSRPFGAQYPIVANDSATPAPTAYRSEPGETCERVAGADVPSIIIPPPPGVSAELRGQYVVVHWALGRVHGDCPPSELVLSSPMKAYTMHEPVHAGSGVTRMRLVAGATPPEQVTARVVSVDGTQSRAVAVLVRRS